MLVVSNAAWFKDLSSQSLPSKQDVSALVRTPSVIAHDLQRAAFRFEVRALVTSALAILYRSIEISNQQTHEIEHPIELGSFNCTRAEHTRAAAIVISILKKLGIQYSVDGGVDTPLKSITCKLPRDPSAQWCHEMFEKNARHFVTVLDHSPVPVDFLLQLQHMVGYRALSGRILDLGCGPGRLTPYLQLLAQQVVGIDSSESFIRLARERAEKSMPLSKERVSYLHGDFRKLASIIDGRFSLICRFYTSMGYFDDRVEAEVLRDCYRVAEKGGFLVIDTFNGAFFKAKHHVQVRTRTMPKLKLIEHYKYDQTGNRLECRWDYAPSDETPFSIPFSLKAYDQEKLTQMLHDAGFEVQQVYADYSGTIVHPHSPLSERLVFVAKAR